MRPDLLIRRGAAPRRSRQGARLIAALAALLLGAACGPPEREVPRSDLRLLWTAAVQGFIEPCGCTAGRIGGLDRIADYVRAEIARHPAALFVDGGDLAVRRHGASDFLAQQYPLKVEAFMRTFADLGIAAMAVGDLDLSLGADVLKAAAERHGVPLVNANITRRDGTTVFEPYVVVQRGGRKIGIFSVIADRLRSDDLDDRRPINVSAMVADQGFVLLNWADVAKRTVETLREQERVDMVLCASHLGWRLNQNLAREVDGIDVVFGAHFDAAKDACVWVEGTPVLTSAVRGARVGTVDWWWTSPREYFGGPRPGALDDRSTRVWPTLERDILASDLALLEGRRDVLGAQEFDRRRGTIERSLAESERRLEDAGPWRRGNAFSAVQVPMHAGVGRDEGALASVDLYHDALHEHWTKDPPRSRHPTQRFVGPAACDACHPAQTEFWRGTAHSRAFATLRATQQHVDLECIGCHTVGLDLPSGFRHPGASAGFENVQCAACHGPEGPHVAGGASYLDRSVFRPPLQSCAHCHDKEHDPPFLQEAAERIPKVTCPPMEPPGQGTAALRSALVEGARVLERDARPEWSRISDAYHLAGDMRAAADAAAAWVSAAPRSVHARLRLAQRRVDLAEWPEVLELADGVLAEEAANGLAWQLRAAALLKLGRGQEGLEAALEARSLRPNDLDSAVLVARAYLDTGDRLRALDALRQHAAARPTDAAAIQPWIESIGG